MASDDTTTPRTEAQKRARSGLTPAERSLRARVAVTTSWAQTDDWSARTANARAASPGSLDYWANQIDPDGTMPVELREKRAAAARSAHYSRMSLAASKARRAKRATK